MLTFPNPSRSIDEGQSRIRFWGYDGPIEVTFYLDVAALQKIDSGMMLIETAMLSSFDRALERIREVAGTVYARRRKPSYTCVLSVSDF